MSEVRVGAEVATFPKGYQVGRLLRFLFSIANRWRGLRAAVLALPPSRLRTALLGRYVHYLVELIQLENFSWLPTVREDAKLDFFSMETYTGKEGWRDGVTQLHEVFGLELEVSEVINPRNSGVLMLAISVDAEAASSGINLVDNLYFVFKLEAGMSIAGQLLSTSREAALEAAGLAE